MSSNLLLNTGKSIIRKILVGLSENDEKYFVVLNLHIFSYVFFRVGHKSKLKQTTLGKFQSWKDGQIEMNDHTIQILKSGPYFNKSEVQEKISNLC